MVTVIPSNNAHDYTIICRACNQIPKVLQTGMANMRQGMKESPDAATLFAGEGCRRDRGTLPPKPALPARSPNPQEKFPTAVHLTIKNDLKAAVLAAVNTEDYSRLQKFTVFVHDEYAPQGRTDPGRLGTADGEARYRQ